MQSLREQEQELEDVLEGAFETAHEDKARGRRHTAAISRDVDRADIPFDDWALLEQMVRRIKLGTCEEPERRIAPTITRTA